MDANRGKAVNEAVTITVEVRYEHDWCKVRRLLKCLLRSYGLRCVDLSSRPIVDVDEVAAGVEALKNV